MLHKTKTKVQVQRTAFKSLSSMFKMHLPRMDCLEVIRRYCRYLCLSDSFKGNTEISTLIEYITTVVAYVISLHKLAPILPLKEVRVIFYIYSAISICMLNRNSK